MKSTGFVLAATLLLGVRGQTLAGQSGAEAQEKQKKGAKKTPVTSSESMSGAQMYKDYCAVCHGAEGKGNGPAVEFLKSPPPDLRTMAQRNNGKFPADYFAATLRLGTEGGVHGTSDMPIWGPVFQSRDGKRVAEVRIRNLVEFVDSLQQK